MRLLFFFILLSQLSFAQSDSVFIKKIYNEALLRGKAHQDLHELCKDIGPRLSGSAEASMAIQWSEAKMKSYGFDKVYLQPIKVPHWERGNKEVAWVENQDHALQKLHILALGGSIGTNGLLSGEVIMFDNFNELKNAKAKDVKGKIVFLNQLMDAAQIITFKAYGGCYPIRGEGAIEAAKLGAIAVVIRSLGLPEDQFPHTGSMKYDDKVTKIPAAALSTEDANSVAKLLKIGSLTLHLELDCRVFPDAESFNVIAEMTGKKSNEIITFGGHLDSWDTGEGAHDDGAGVIHCSLCTSLRRFSHPYSHFPHS